MKFTKRVDCFGEGIFSKLVVIKKEKMAKGEEIIDLSIGVPNIPPAPHIREVLCKGAANLSDYTYVISDRNELLDAIAGWYKGRYGVELDPQREVCPPLGSQEGLAHIALAMVDEGDMVLVPDPCYPVSGDGSKIVGVDLHCMPQKKENGYITQLDEIPGDVAQKVKLMAVSYPNNPTTAMAPGSLYQELITFARKYDIIVLHDNAYSDLVFDSGTCGSFLRFPDAKGVGIEFNSLSKTYGLTGAGIGFCLGNENVVSRSKLLKSNMDYGTFLFIQGAAIVAVIGDQDCVKTAMKAYEARRNTMCDGFTRIGWKMERPVAAMFVWVAIPKYYKTSEEFVTDMVEKAGVMMTPGSAFGPSGEGYARLALAQDEEALNRAIEAVDRSGILKEQE